MHVQVCLLCLVYLHVFAPLPHLSAVSAAVVHACSTPMHDAHNSCSDTALNSLRVQRCSKVRQSCRVRSRSVEQIVDMSPAPAAGTYQRSSSTVHDQRQVPRKRLAESFRAQVLVQVLGPGGRSGLCWGSLGPRCGLSWRFLVHW